MADKGTWIKFRLSIEEKQRFSELARTSGMSLSAWLRLAAYAFADVDVRRSLAAAAKKKVTKRKKP